MVLLTLAALLAQPDRDPRLIGHWAFVDAVTLPPGPAAVCGTDFGISYAADGSWRNFSGDERGTWRTRADRLEETLTHITDQVDDRERQVRRMPTRFRMQWIDADHVNLRRGKAVHGLERCLSETAG